MCIYWPCYWKAASPYCIFIFVCWRQGEMCLPSDQSTLLWRFTLSCPASLCTACTPANIGWLSQKTASVVGLKVLIDERKCDFPLSVKPVNRGLSHLPQRASLVWNSINRITLGGGITERPWCFGRGMCGRLCKRREKQKKETNNSVSEWCSKEGKIKVNYPG